MSLPPRQNGSADRDQVAALRLVDRFQRGIRRNRRSEIVESLQQLVELRAPMADQWLQMASIAVDIGEVRLARGAIDLYVDHFDGHPAAQFKKLGILARIGAFAEALELVRTIPPELPDRFSYAQWRGVMAVNAGESAEAREWLEEAIRVRPQSGEAWYWLAQLVDFAREQEMYLRIIQARNFMEGVSAYDGAYYCYAMGKAHADNRQHARAFAAFERAASEWKALYPNDWAQERQLAEEAVKGYDAARIAALARGQTEPTARAIFVMGLPRSGTTLVEQILTSHSTVSDGGEIDFLRLLAHEAGNASYPALENYAGQHGVAPLARYWESLIDGRFPQAGRAVDKTTSNTRMLGIAAAVLPEAPLVWLRRNPLDCAWSCFRTSFKPGIRWSNDLRDIAYYFRLDDYLLTQWQNILGERLLVVPMEELAGEPEAWIRRIASHCGLTEEPQIFAPHENTRAVATASVLQVRKPINRAGIGSAEPYREFLRPFIDAYYG